MKHLFTHTSGIVYPIFTDKGRSGYMKAKITDAFPDGSIDLAENIRRLASVPLAHQPGDGLYLWYEYECFGPGDRSD